MENSIDDKISCKEHPIYISARKFKENGYKIGTGYGMVLDEVGRNSAGDYVFSIIEPKEPEARGLLGLLGIKTQQRSKHVGTLYFDADGDRIAAKHDEKWVLEVYGRENLPVLTDIVKELSNKYNTKVEINLVKEQSQTEYLSCDLPD